MVEEDEGDDRQQQAKVRESLEQKTDIEDGISSTVGGDLVQGAECPTENGDTGAEQEDEDTQAKGCLLLENNMIEQVIEEVSSVAEAQDMLDEESPSQGLDNEVAQMTEEKVPVLQGDPEVSAPKSSFSQSDDKPINVIAPKGDSGPAPIISYAMMLKSAPPLASVPSMILEPQVPTKKDFPDSNKIRSAGEVARANPQQAVPTFPWKNESDKAGEAKPRSLKGKSAATRPAEDGWQVVDRNSRRNDGPSTQTEASASVLIPELPVEVKSPVPASTSALTKTQKERKRKRRKAKKRAVQQEQTREQEAGSPVCITKTVQRIVQPESNSNPPIAQSSHSGVQAEPSSSMEAIGVTKVYEDDEDVATLAAQQREDKERKERKYSVLVIFLLLVIMLLILACLD